MTWESTKLVPTVKSLLEPRVLFYLSTFNGHFYLVKFGYNLRFRYYTKAGTNRGFTVYKNSTKRLCRNISQYCK